MIASHWLQTGGISGDTNGDGIVNGLDINSIASRLAGQAASGRAQAVVPVAVLKPRPCIAASNALSAVLSRFARAYVVGSLLDLSGRASDGGDYRPTRPRRDGGCDRPSLR